MVFKSVKVLITTIGLCLGSAAIAEDLVYYSTTLNGTDFYYDAETIRRYSNNTVEVWQNVDASKDKTASFNTMKSKLRFNCVTETSGALASVFYRADGTVIDSGDFQYPKMVSITPGTPLNTLFKILCSK